MDEQTAIEPSVERVVDFYGDSIPAAQTVDAEIFVPLRPLTDFLGLNYSGQQQRIGRDDEMIAKCHYVTMQMPNDVQRRAIFCLPLELVPAWLFGVTTSRVKPELRAKLSRYRQECFRVLWNAFKGDILPASRQVQTLTPAEQILQQTEALYKLAQQQVELERQYKTMAEYTKGFIRETRGHLTALDTTTTDHEQRLVSIELRLDPAANITDAEAAEIALGVKNVAYAMGGGSRSYGKVYSEIYRRYRISSYKNLPAAKYDEVIAWLSRWYEEVTGNDSDDVGMEN